MGHFKPVETEYDLDRSFEPVKERTLKCFRNAVQVSPFCLVELWLAIFWAVFTGFSCFLVVASERGFLCLSKNL